MDEISGLTRKVLGAVLLVLVAVIALGVIGGYGNWFSGALRATVTADRAGLLMNPGAAVNLRGLKIGEVRAIHPGPSGAELDIALDRDQVAHIPANVTASIGTPTLFGAKYVDLAVPDQPSRERIAEGARIHAGTVVTEANTLLENLNTLLASIDVAKLNGALGGLSTGLQGRGDRLGTVFVHANDYLNGLNPSVPQLARDLAVGADVTTTYAQATPNLVNTLDNLRVTSGTLVETDKGIRKLLSHVKTISGDAHDLFKDNGDELEDLVDTLRPTTALLDEYAPMYPCLFASVNQVRQNLEQIFGFEYPGIHTYTSFLPASDGYRNPRDLPKLGVKVPPTCWGGPLRPNDVPFPHVIFDDGWQGFALSNDVYPPGNLPPSSSPLNRSAAGPDLSPLVKTGRGLDGLVGQPSGPGARLSDPGPPLRPAPSVRAVPDAGSVPDRVLGGLGGGGLGGLHR